jgi:glutamine cyclotransferase
MLTIVMYRLHTLIALVVVVLPLRAAANTLPYEVVGHYPHSTALFTQGLELFHGQLFESSGLYGHSKVIARPLPEGSADAEESTETLRGVTLDKSLFAEGLTFYRGRLYLLTWRAGQLLEIDPERFALLRRHRYRGQGWGICYHLRRDLFAMSNGSDEIQWRRTGDFSLVDTLTVTGPGNNQHLNELECHGDYILANQWKQPYLLVIDARSGEVVSRLDLSALIPEGLHEEAVLNGIAYDARDNTWLVTGKLWPKIYRIRFTLPALETAKTAAKAR